jgi:hypothetical protein
VVFGFQNLREMEILLEFFFFCVEFGKNRKGFLVKKKKKQKKQIFTAGFDQYMVQI